MSEPKKCWRCKSEGCPLACTSWDTDQDYLLADITCGVHRIADKLEFIAEEINTIRVRGD